MSEPKLCPFIKNGVACVDQDLVSGMWDCVENKCAMWREGTIDKRTVYDGGALSHLTYEGYCGLAGKP